MSEEDYTVRLRSMQRYIPFLENMIDQLKDPKMKNREQQLSKMESLYGMITDKKKKLKVETLAKCEEVIVKLYKKVKGENAALPPPYDGERRKSQNFSSESSQKRRNYNDFDILPSSSGSIRKQEQPKSFFIRKPPISYADLEVLEKDVASELERQMSLQELNSLRNELFQKLEETDKDPVISKNKTENPKVHTPERHKRITLLDSPPLTHSSDVKKTNADIPKNSDIKKSPLISAPKVLKEADLFINTFSELDRSYENDAKKKERKNSTGTEQVGKKLTLAEQMAKIKQLAEKAAELRNKVVPLNTSPPTVSPGCNENANTALPSSDLDPPAPPVISGMSDQTSQIVIAKEVGESISCKDQRDKILNFKTNGTSKTEDNKDPSKTLVTESIFKNILDMGINLRTDPPKTIESNDKSPQDKVKDSQSIIQNILDMGINLKEKEEDPTEIMKDPEKIVKHIDINVKNDQPKSAEAKDKDFKDKTKDMSDSKDKATKKVKSNKDDKHSKDKKHNDYKKEHKSERKKDEKPREKYHDKDKKNRDKKLHEKVKDKADHSKSEEKKNKSEVPDGKPSETHKDKSSELSKVKIGELPRVKPSEPIKEKLSEPFRGKPSEPTKEKPSEPSKEIKPISRDPRLRFGSIAASTAASAQNKDVESRLAFKYNPKPKKLNPEVDLERNVADSIEKSMKESHVPLPPKAQLQAPPAPPDDLFSPASPDEIDKAPVPAILNEILLNPKTTGVINEVVTALKRSNNENNIIPLMGMAKIPSNDIPSIPLPLFNRFQQGPEVNFPVPVLQMNRIVSPVLSPVFVPPKPVPAPVLTQIQPRGFNPFSPEHNNVNDEMPVLDFQPPMNAVQNFEVSMNPPQLTPYEDRMTQQGFHMERSMNFVPPSPSFDFVPPSPRYDGGDDGFRDMQRNKNFHNFQGERIGQPQGFYDNGGINRQNSLLGDYPQRTQFNAPQFGHQNYDNFCNNQVAPGGFVEARKPFFGGSSRDPRMNMNRGNQFAGSDPRMMGRDSRMTYREYKEQRERENRERLMREKEIRERENRDKELLERQKKDVEIVQPIEIVDLEKIEDRKERDLDRDGSRSRNRSRDRDRSRDRSRDRYSRNRSSSRYRRDTDSKREKSRERPRYSESRFDKVYSSREKDKEDFTSPLDSLYATSSAKTGKGYGMQFKIPKKIKEEDKPKKEEKPKKDEEKVKKEDVKLKREDEKPETEEEKPKIKEEKLKREEEKPKEELIKEEKVKDLEVSDKKVEEKLNNSKKGKKIKKSRKRIIEDEIEDDDIKGNVKSEKFDTTEEDDLIEIKEKVPIVEIEDRSEDTIEKEVKNSVEKVSETVEEVNEPVKEVGASENANDKPQDTTGKKNEEESILSKFFQNLMKSSNKDEKKGALLSLISTFSDSFSDQQLKKITNIIQSEKDEEDKPEDTTKTEEVSHISAEENDATECPNDKSEEPPMVLEKETSKVIEKETPTLVELLTENVEQEKKDETEVSREEDLEDNNPVQVSVGERIKNRKRADTPKPEAVKTKVKLKTELDRLHEDIREMFIRDGVVTATGKRMCRILKDSTDSVVTESAKSETEISHDEVKKKTPVGKKKGRPFGKKTVKENAEVEMRELSVILPKMSLDKMREVEDNADKRYTLRKLAKATNYNEDESESSKAKEIKISESVSEDNASTKEDEEVESKKESEQDTSVAEPKKIKAKKRFRRNWATGVIKKKNISKSKKTKSPTRSEDAVSLQEEEIDDPEPSAIGDLLYLHDKDYYFKSGQTSMQCKVCDVSTKWIAAHYRSEHPDIEVLSSRLPPDIVEFAIEDATANKGTYEKDTEESLAKHAFSCIFCKYSQSTLPRLYRDHVSIHTGEFRHKCPYCSYKRCHIKTMQAHVAEAHAEEEATLKRRIISQPAKNFRNIYAYLCEVCNYLQMNLQNVQEHVKIYHSGTQNCRVHKIKMNNKFSPNKKSTSPARKTTCKSKKLSPTKDRLTRQSSKQDESEKSNAEDDEAPEINLGAAMDSERQSDNEDDLPPQLTKEVEEPITTTQAPKELEKLTESSESQTSIDEPVTKKPRKRAPAFAKPGPGRRRRKRSTKATLSSTDIESGSDVPPSPKKETKNEGTVVVKKIDEAVFTCNTDLQEENKQIEEERLKKMQDINSTIKLRTSLDFVEKLSNRLKQEEEEEVVVKEEPRDPDEGMDKIPPNEFSVFEKKRDVEQTIMRQDSSPKITKDCGKANTIINGVIEKLQGILSNQPPSVPVDENLPPMKHKNQVEQKVEVNSQVLNIGPIKIIKSLESAIYACCSPPCIFSSRDQGVFSAHCQFNHDWDDNIEKFPNCVECGAKLECDMNTPLLTSALNHANKSHMDFLGIKVGSIRISSNLFPDKKTARTDDDDNNDSAISTPPTISIPSPPGIDDHVDDHIDPLISSEVIPNDFENENPFSFKIVDVVSLAEEDPSPTIDQEAENVDGDDGSSNVIPNSPKKAAKNTLNQQARTSEKIIITPSMIKAPTKPKKSPGALKKFLAANNDLFKCPEFACLFTTNKRKMFDIHIGMHQNHNKKTFSCLYCEKCLFLEGMGDHYEQVHGMCRFACFYCLYRCMAKDYMDIHQLLVHRDVIPRMQLLPKRDAEEKKLISILSDATKSATLLPYLCIDQEFVYYPQFLSHVKTCPNNPQKACYFKKGPWVCGMYFDDAESLGKHWGEAHAVFPLKCAYCVTGSFEISDMMIHLVSQHPTLPPDIIDRFTVPKNKNQTCPSRAQCNFQKLVADLRSDSSRWTLPSLLKSKAATETVTSPPPIVTTKSPTMQKAFENFVQHSSAAKAVTVASKSVTTYSKMTPVNLVAASTSNTGLSILKTTNNPSLLGSGGVVYCLAGPTMTTQNQIVQAIVVNKDCPTGVAQKVRLLSPVTLPKTDAKFQMVKGVHKGLPLMQNVPKLTPISSIPRMISMGTVQPIVLNEISKAPAQGESASTSNNQRADTETNESGSADVPPLEAVSSDAVTGGTEKEALNTVEDNTVLPNLEEPMMVIDDNFENKEQDDAIDPLSLEMEDPPTSQSPISHNSLPFSAMTPMHEYDSDSKDQDPQDVPIQKTGLIGYQLYRCAACDLSFSDSTKFKEHVINSNQCKFENASNKPFKCVHCGKFMKHYSNLLDHLGYHGPLRFLCSLCNKRYSHGNQVKHHMKSRHNVVSIVMQPLRANRTNLNYDDFVIKPQTVGNVKTPIKDAGGEGETLKAGEIKTIFYSHEADDIPQKSILSYDITCGHCKKFKNKVRSNIVRHLLLHKNDSEFTVPDTAPVNPVPCLEKNEKMFDKMCNLASSSHVGGRMGGQQKGDTKKVDKVPEDDYPAFVPANKRFQCCAVGCTYLCLEEGNLRHHLTALHMEDPNFVCVHCKRDLSDAADVDTILKHLKLHELHLYKCSSCDFMHNLRHKIERHVGEKHKNKDSTVMVIRAMDSEPYDENQHVLAPFPVVMNQKSMKPWRCCMCKYRCYTQDEAEIHAKNKHDIDCRYKCALCTFKSNEMPEFTDHFKLEHPDSDIDIILVYHKEDESNEGQADVDQFDTTPLWRRDKPRVRHIRGILFEENSPAKKKTTPVKVAAEQNPISQPGPSSAKKRKRSMSTISESPKVVEDGEEELKKEPEVVADKSVSNNDEVIVIEDDDEEERTEEQEKSSCIEVFDDIDLMCTFGDVGMPLNKHFKCPKCDKYRSTKMRDFIQHVAKEMNYYRFICSICENKFITLEDIKIHCLDHHDCSISSVTPLPVDEPMSRWLTILLEKQRTIIRNLGFTTEELPNDIDDFLGSHEITSKPSAKEQPIKCNECGFVVSGPQAMDRHLKYNHPHIAYTSSSPSQPATSATTPRDQQTAASSSAKKRPSDCLVEESPPIKKSRTTKVNLIAKDKYVCSFCNVEYDSVPEIEYHAKERHNGEVMYVVQTTELPMAYEYGRNIYRCRYCATTGSKPTLEVHSVQDHPGHKFSVYRFACGVCPAKFEVIKSFRQHFKSHNLATIFYFDVYDKRVDVKARGVNTNKNKMYKCPICPYVSHSSNPTNMKTHLKIHAKPFQCELCFAQFKTRPDSRAHHLKEHPHNVEMILERPDMIQKINTLMEEVLRTMEQTELIQKTLENETIEVDSDHNEAEQLEVVPDILEEPEIEVIQPKIKYCAKKSTSSLAKRNEVQEYYSYYGQKPESVDMKKIVTTFEIADAKMRMTCDQLGRIYNLKPSIILKDCMTLIIEEDDELSS